MQQFFLLRQPLDRIAMGLMFCLTVLIVLMIGSGDHSIARVRDFSWQNRLIGAEDAAFILTFSRPMDQASVEKNLSIEPPLPGKFSWAGRRMAYTPLSPAPYGLEYKLKLAGARDQAATLDYYAGNKNQGLIDPFLADFKSRDRAFVYIGVTGEETGRLILQNLTQNQKTILTAPNLVVTEFQSYPNADRLLFSAIPQVQQSQKGINQQLYTVTTGMFFPAPEEPLQPPLPAGEVNLVLDNKAYNLLKFDISPDGKTIIVQRINRDDPTDLGLWKVEKSKNGSDSLSTFTTQRLEQAGSGEFEITPDSSSIAVLQGQGVAIVPLSAENAAKDWEFLPKFGRVMDFSRDGTGAAMVKFNVNYTRSLFHITNQGKEELLLETLGSIMDCQYHPDGQSLYCLLTELIEGETYTEKPYLAIIDIATAKIRPLLIFPDQRNMQMSLSPDGKALLFDSLVTMPPKNDLGLRTKDGQEITKGSLWALPLNRLQVDQPDILPEPEELPLAGYHPLWLP